MTDLDLSFAYVDDEDAPIIPVNQSTSQSLDLSFVDVSPIEYDKPPKPEERGFWQKAKDIFTGNDRETDTSRSTPSLMDVGISKFLGPRSKLSDDLIASAGMLTSYTPEQQFNILKNATPDPMVMDKDEKGNLYAIRFDPETQQGHKIQLNPPGFDVTDAAQVAGGMALYTPAGRMGAGAATIKGAAAKVGLGSAGTQALTSGYNIGIAGSEQNLKDAAIDVGIAGGVGALSEGASQLIGGGIKRLAAAYRNKKINAQEAKTGLQKLFIEAGQDPEKVTDEMIKGLAEVGEDGLTILEKEYGITLSKGGRASLNYKTDKERLAAIKQLEYENLLRTNTNNKGSAEFHLREGAQNRQIEQAKNKVLSDIAQDATLIDSTEEAGDIAIGGIKLREEIAEKAVREGYENVENAELTKKGASDLLKRTRESLENDIDFVDTDLSVKAIKKIRDYEKAVGDATGDGYPFGQVEAHRKALGRLWRDAADKTDKRQIKKLIDRFDMELDDAVINALKSGDETVIEQMKTARGLARKRFFDFGEGSGEVKLTGGKVKDKAGQYVERMLIDDMDGAQVMNTLWGVNHFRKDGATQVAKRLKGLLGEGSHEWNAMRQAAFLRMIKTTPELSDRVISPRQTATQITKAMENPKLMRVFFTGEEIVKLKGFGKLLSGVNPDLGPIKSRSSPSGVHVEGMVKRLGAMFQSYGIAMGNPISITTAGVTLARGIKETTRANNIFTPEVKKLAAGGLDLARINLGGYQMPGVTSTAVLAGAGRTSVSRDQDETPEKAPGPTPTVRRNRVTDEETMKKLFPQ